MNMFFRAFAVLSCLAAPLGAQVIVVNAALDDAVDFGGAQLVTDLPGPDGLVTLREAVTAANNTPGPQTITFAIPVSEWSIFYPDRAIIRQEYMAYVSGDDTTIDFSTQAQFTGDTNPIGNEVGLQYAGPPAGIPNLWLAGNRCTIRGLDVTFGNNFDNGIWITGNDCRVVGCTTGGLTVRGDYGGGANNTIGGTAPGDGNTFLSAVSVLSHANNNVIVGNIFRWGLRINGDTFWGTCDHTRVGGPSPAERNVLAGHGYTGEEGLPVGAELEIYYAKGTLVENNFVGTTNDGSAKYPDRTGVVGIGVDLGAENTVVRNNVVSGIERTGSGHYQGQRFGVAVGVASSASNTKVVGNKIGVAADGVTPVLNVQGVVVSSNPNGNPLSTFIGGAGPGEGNRIANNEFTGVRVLNSAIGARISGNSIFSNGTLGIDLQGTLGVTPNDAGDADTGPNGLQNFPVLSLAQAGPAAVRIAGSLNSLPGESFAVEFFSSASCDPSGNGEGEIFLGGASIATGSNGIASFEVSLPVPVAVGSMITATATQSATGNTSEFSACLPATAPTCPADFNADGFVTGDDYDAFVDEFIAGNPTADFNGDGFITGDDFDAFVQAFLSGC